MSRAVTLIWLTALWVLLWRDPSPGTIVSGLVAAVVVTRALSLGWAGTHQHRVRPLALLRFLAYFTWKLLEANVVLAREVVTPQNRIRTGIVAVPLTGCSDLVVTTVANAVSLTPGTLTLEVRRADDVELYVHVLHLHDIERARADVHTLARLASAALQRDPAARAEARP